MPATQRRWRCRSFGQRLPHRHRLRWLRHQPRPLPRPRWMRRLDASRWPTVPAADRRQPPIAAPTRQRPPPDTTGAVPPADARPRRPRPRSTFRPMPARSRCAMPPPVATPRRCSRSARATPKSRGVKEDMAAAAKWYEKSAELGFAPARIPHRQFLREGHRRRARHQEGEDLVPARRRTGQRQRHAQSGRAVRHGRGWRDRQ